MSENINHIFTSENKALFSLTELVTSVNSLCLHCRLKRNDVFDLDIESLIKMDNEDITSSVNVN